MLAKLGLLYFLVMLVMLVGKVRDKEAHLFRQMLVALELVRNVMLLKLDQVSIILAPLTSSSL